MSDEQKNAGDSGAATAAVSSPHEQRSPDEHTTVPNSPEEPQVSERAAGKWEMPKPKFQQTSGYLPQGYLKDIKGASQARSAAGSEDTTQDQVPFAADAATSQVEDGGRPASPPSIEPQPDLLDQLIPEEPVLDSPSADAAKSVPAVVTVVLSIAGILIFIAVFIAAVYYLFLGGRTGGGATF